MPGRAWNVSADAGQRLTPRPAATYSRHSSMVRAVAPMTGGAPLGRGLRSQSSRQAVGWQPSVAAAAAIQGSASVSLRSRQSRPASGWPEGSTHTRGSSARVASSRPAARIGGRTKATSVLRSSRPPAGWVSSKRVQPDLDSGFLTLERREDLRGQVAARRDAQADGQHAPDCAGRVAGGRRSPVQFGQGGSAPRPGSWPRRSDRRAAAAALQEPDTQDRFELLDLGAQHLLGDVHAPGRGGEAAFLGDRDEITQMPDLNVHPGRSYRPGAGSGGLASAPRFGDASAPRFAGRTRTVTCATLVMDQHDLSVAPRADGGPGHDDLGEDS